tara:strand:+ start:1824 stop:2435 length:612 start_codon:yes stop_codon:yes gene_type:complete
MQPNPWDDGGQSESPSSPSPNVNPEPIIVGMPQQINQQMGQQMGQQIVYLQPQSSSPKVLGIFVIIWGAFSFLGVFLNFIPLEDPTTGEELIVPVSVIMVNVMNSALVAITCMLGGYWMTQYQKKGIQLVLIGIIVSYFLGLVSVSLGGDGGLGELLGDDSAVFAVIAVSQGICSVICGLLVAIPLMNAAQGLDESSLFSQLK